MKNVFVGITFCLCSLFSKAQNLTGTWEGVFFSNQNFKVQKQFLLHMELKQTDHQLVGVFSTADFTTPDKPDIVYKVSGLLGKKEPLKLFHLMYEGVLMTNVSKGIADAFLEFQCTYMTKDSSEFIAGKWFPNEPSARSDGAGGNYQIKKFSNEVGQLFVDYIDNKGKKKKTAQNNPARDADSIKQ